jgi:CRP-like cAMP-binding protein
VEEKRVRTIPLFASLSKKHVSHVARCADEVDVDEGKHLVNEGAFAYEFFAIEEGTAEVRHGEECVANLGPGDIFGEVGALGHLQRNATVVATSPMTLIVMGSQELRVIANEMPEVADQLRATIAERVSPDTSAS